jgi:hypothetical protein
VEVLRLLLISASKTVRKGVEIELLMKIKTGDLVKTTNSWDGWITLGVAICQEDLATISKQLKPKKGYVYVKPLAGKILSTLSDLEKFGAYKESNLEILSSME